MSHKMPQTLEKSQSGFFKIQKHETGWQILEFNMFNIQWLEFWKLISALPVCFLKILVGTLVATESSTLKALEAWMKIKGSKCTLCLSFLEKKEA